MKTFTVEREFLRGSVVNGGEVYADGEVIDANAGDEIEIREITTGFTVHSYEDNEHLMTDFYPVQTNTGQWTDNSEEVLKQIREDYPAGEWQNGQW